MLRRRRSEDGDNSWISWLREIVLVALLIGALQFVFKPSRLQRDYQEAFAHRRAVEASFLQHHSADRFPVWVTRLARMEDETLLKDSRRIFDVAARNRGIPEMTRPHWGLLFHVLGDSGYAGSALNLQSADVAVGNQAEIVKAFMDGRKVPDHLAQWANQRYEEGTSELPEWYYLAFDAGNREVESWIREKGETMFRRGLVADSFCALLALLALIGLTWFVAKGRKLSSDPVHRRIVGGWAARRIVREFCFAELLGILAAVLLSPIPARFGWFDVSMIVSGICVMFFPAAWLVFRMTPGPVAAFRILGIRRPKWAKRHLFLFGMGGLGVLALIGVLGLLLANAGALLSDTIREENLDSKLRVAWAFIAAGIFAAFCEEVIFRGFLFGGFAEKWGAKAAAIVTSLLFASMHFYSSYAFLIVFLYGLTFCWLYRRSGSLWPGIIAHSAFNFAITAHATAWLSLH